MQHSDFTNAYLAGFSSDKFDYSNFTTGEEKFCTEENSDQCLLYLNKDLLSLGLEAIFDKHTARFNLITLLNNVHELIRKQRVNHKAREDLDCRNLRINASLENVELANSRLKEMLENSEREKAQMKEKERQLNLEIKNLTSKLKSEREEVRKLQSLMDSRDSQYKHNLKKKENEASKLKDRLRQLLSEKSDRKLGMELTAALNKAGSKRATWVTSTSHEEDLYQSILNTHEERVKILMVENNDLRRCLTVVNRDLEETLQTLFFSSRRDEPLPTNEVFSDSNTNDVNSGDVCLSEQNAGHFQMPYNLVGNEIIENLKEKCSQLRQHAASVSSLTADQSCSKPNENTYRTELDKMAEQLEKYREIICQQEQLLQFQLDAAATHTDCNGHSPGLSESTIWEEREKLDRERQLLNEQRARFEQDRRSITETAIRIGQERRLLEEEKETQLKEQFFQMTPFRTLKATNSFFESTPTNRNKRLLPCAPGMDLYGKYGNVSASPAMNKLLTRPTSTKSDDEILKVNDRNRPVSQPSIMSTGEPSKLSAQFVKKKEQQQSFSDGEESPRSPPIGVSVTRLPSKERLMHGHVSSYDAADGNDTVNNAKQSSYRHDLMHVISTPLDKVAMPHGHLNNAMPGKASVPHIPQYSPASACDYNFNWARSGSSQLLPSGDMSMAYDKSVKSNTDGLSYDNISSIS